MPLQLNIRILSLSVYVTNLQTRVVLTTGRNTVSLNGRKMPNDSNNVWEGEKDHQNSSGTFQRNWLFSLATCAPRKLLHRWQKWNLGWQILKGTKFWQCFSVFLLFFLTCVCTGTVEITLFFFISHLDTSSFRPAAKSPSGLYTHYNSANLNDSLTVMEQYYYLLHKKAIVH